MLSLCLSTLVLGFTINSSIPNLDNSTVSHTFSQSQIQQPIQRKTDSRKRSKCDTPPKSCTVKKSEK